MPAPLTATHCLMPYCFFPIFSTVCVCVWNKPIVQLDVILLLLGLWRRSSSSLLVGSHVEYFSPMPETDTGMYVDICLENDHLVLLTSFQGEVIWVAPRFSDTFKALFHSEAFVAFTIPEGKPQNKTDWNSLNIQWSCSLISLLLTLSCLSFVGGNYTHFCYIQMTIWGSFCIHSWILAHMHIASTIDLYKREPDRSTNS